MERIDKNIKAKCETMEKIHLGGGKKFYKNADLIITVHRPKKIK